MELIDKDGNFNQDIKQDLKLMRENCPVGIVSAIGVQGSGKSTVLNKIFGTVFPVRDVEAEGLGQATRGIWIASSSSQQPGGGKILIMDTEGSDGAERALQGNSTFERIIALFVLALSTTIIFNMKHENVNRYEGGSWPLLQIVFEVMVRRIKPDRKRKRNLVFLLRDKIPEINLDMAEKQLLQRLDETWKKMSSQSRTNAAPGDYFNITVMALPHYLHQRQTFENEVDNLRTQIVNMIKKDQLSPASTFVTMAKNIWRDIKDDKILNLQVNRRGAHQMYCCRVATEKCKGFSKDKVWRKNKSNVESHGNVEGFGKSVSSVIDTYLKKYDEETAHFDKDVRMENRNYLKNELLKVVEPIHRALVDSHMSKALAHLQEELVKRIIAEGKLDGRIDPDPFINRFKKLLEDAKIERANWNHPSQQINTLKLHIEAFEKGCHVINEELKKKKKNRKIFWLKVVKNGCKFLGISMAIVLQILLSPVIGPAALGPDFAVMGLGITPVIIKRLRICSSDGDAKKAIEMHPEWDSILKQLPE